MSSYSDFDTHARCPMKFKYRVEWGIQPQSVKASLHEGSAQHKVQEYGLLLLREGGLTKDTLHSAVGQLRRDGKELRFPQEQAEYEELLATCERRFWRWLFFYDSLERWEILHVEEQFTIVADGVEITCTPDLVVRDRYNGGVWVVDLKTAATIPDSDSPNLQSYINLAAVRTVYPEAAGFMFDYMRKKEPTQPTLVKSGAHVSRLKTVDTDYRTLVEFLELEAPHLLDDPEHRERLAELRVSDQDKWFKRFPFHISDETLANALDDVVTQAGIIEAQREHYGWYRVHLKGAGYQSCDSCGYQTICNAELTGGDVERTLEQFYEPRDLSYKDYEVSDA